MPGALARLLLRRIVTRPCRLVPAVGGGPKCPPCGPGKVRSHCYIRAPPATLFPFLMDALEPSQPPCTRAGCRSASPTRTARATGAWVACAPLVPSATTASGTPTRRLSTAAVSTAAACPAAGVSARPTDCADYPPALPAYTVRLCPCSSLSPLPPPAATGKTCRINSDCKSGSCEDGRCAEAKHCDSRGVSDEQRKFGAHLHHQDPITCGQCVCKDCPVSARLGLPPAVGQPLRLRADQCASPPRYVRAIPKGRPCPPRSRPSRPVTRRPPPFRAGQHHLLHVHSV